MRTRKKVYADKMKKSPPPSKSKEAAAVDGDDEDIAEEAKVDEQPKPSAPPVASPDGGGSDDDDDEAPEDVGFSEAKSLAFESMAVQKKSKAEEAEKKKEKRRLQLERNVQQKEKKVERLMKRKTEDELSLDFLEKLDEASKTARRNNVKRLDTGDDSNADHEVAFRAPTSTASGNEAVSVVAPRDEKGLKRLVDPAVLDFRQRMMFDPRKNRRESTSAVIRRKEKIRALGKDFSKPIR